ncbi:MAG: T9SS type A sorting domain-containing protein [Flavisolibacter sp.]
MKVFFLAFFSIVILQQIQGQVPGVLMQRCVGDSTKSALYCLNKANDNGYIAAGYCSAKSGDVTEYKGGVTDGWIVKLSEQGGIQWQKSMGGSVRDDFHDIIPTKDGGYIACGGSGSYDGDITSGHSVNGNANMEVFIVKLSATGTVQWTKCFGGNRNDEGEKIIETPDGGYLCVGKTESRDGDVSGLHFDSTFGVYPDVWLIKLSATGQLQWQKCYGGPFYDEGNTILATGDGNYLIGAYAGGYGGDMSTMHGDMDAWLIKIDPNGSIIWEKSYGGSGLDLAPQVDTVSGGGYIMAFSTESTDGDVVNNHGSRDIALMKLTENGNILWSKCYGGSSVDMIGQGQSDINLSSNLRLTDDGGYVLAGTTESNDGDVAGNHSAYFMDLWVVKLDANGNLQWQKCLGGTASDYGNAIVPEIGSRQFMLAGETASHDGDVYRNKVGPPDFMRLYVDGWIVRLGAVNTLTGQIFLDNNSNGIKDPNEPWVSGAAIQSKKTGDEKTTFALNGQFRNELDTGAYTTTVSFKPYYTAVPSSVVSPAYTTYFHSDTINFALQSIPNKRDLVVTAFPLGAAKPGFKVTYRVQATNVGTENIGQGSVKFVPDKRLGYWSSTPQGSIIADTISWNFTKLNVSDTLTFFASFFVQPPPITNLGDTITNHVNITPVANDETPNDNSSITRQVLVGSFDPNDKSQLDGGSVSSNFILSGGYLQYMIRFQNTGTDTAFHVRVTDTLDSRLDWSSLQILSSSHPAIVSLENGNQLTCDFRDINLVDSNKNESFSHGFIVYKIKPKTAAPSQIIHNRAAVYFDYNEPVITNDAPTVIQSDATVLPVSLLEFTGEKVGDKVNLSWRIGGSHSFSHFDIQRSTDGVGFVSIGSRILTNATEYNWIDILTSNNGDGVYYRLKMVDFDGKFSYSKILSLKFQTNTEDVFVFPNPSTVNAFVSFTSKKAGLITLQVADASSRVLFTKAIQVEKGKNSIELNTIWASSPGTYFIRIIQNGESYKTKFIIQ